MKVIVTVRTRDEARRIGPFCASYPWADEIIVSDGGSLDDTQIVAASFPNVVLIPFEERTELANGHWRNNDSHHINFLTDRATERGADWIVHDDCDCRPNPLLRTIGRQIIETCDRDFIMAVRLYVWGRQHHFPNMAQPGGPGIWEPSLWAWRASADLKTVDDNFPHYSLSLRGESIGAIPADRTMPLLPPLCLVHYSWDDAEWVTKKVTNHNEAGLTMAHPLVFAGPLEVLPTWARD